MVSPISEIQIYAMKADHNDLSETTVRKYATIEIHCIQNIAPVNQGKK